jgi:AraC-like DNA-binding protein
VSTSTTSWEKAFRLVEPQINAEGTHAYPFDPSFPIDVRFLVLGGRHSIRMHRHHYFELYGLGGGGTTLQVQDRLFAVREGDLVVIGSDLDHRTIDHPKSQPRLVALFFEPELVLATDGTGEEMEYLMPFFGQEPDFPHVVPAGSGLPAQVVELIHRIHKELPATTVVGRLSVKTYLKMILVLLLKYYSGYLSSRREIERRRAGLERLRPVFEYVEKHCDSSIQVEQAARLCAMSTSHFMYFFKRATGQSFLSYVNHFRVAKAQVLLSTSDMPLANISQEVSFCNQSYFGMVFRKLVGVTPLAYRRRIGKGNGNGRVFLPGVSAAAPLSPI